MKRRPDGIPRRCDILLLTKEETMILDCISAVENLGAHPLLTEVVATLGKAKDTLADWVELEPGVP